MWTWSVLGLLGNITARQEGRGQDLQGAAALKKPPSICHLYWLGAKMTKSIHQHLSTSLLHCLLEITHLHLCPIYPLPWHFIPLSPLSARSPRKWCKASVCAEWWVCTLSWAHRKVCGQWSPIKNTHTPFSNTLPWNKVREVAARRPIEGSFFPWSSENKRGGFTASETDVLQWPSTLSF